MKELASNTYSFAEYELDLGRRLLLRAGQSVPLNAKAFDLLVVLIENRERVIAKEELMELVWRDQFVEEANLTVQISALRRVLGEKKDEHRFIVTVPGRGYRFVTDVQNGGAKPDTITGIVIETHTTSHVLVEEEVDTEPETKSVIDLKGTRTRAIGNRGSGLTAYDFDSRSNQSSVVDIAPAQLATRPRNRQKIAWLTAVLGLLFLVGMTLWVYQLRKPNPQAPASSASQQISMRRFTTTRGVPYRVVISPDGKSLVYLQRIDGKDSLWLGQIETNSSVLIHQQPEILYDHITFAPDGGHIYFTMQDGRRPDLTLVRMPIVGGATTELISNVDSAVTFSPGGQRIAFTRRDRKPRQISIMIADATDGKNETTLAQRKWPESFSSGPSWSPDGKTIAICASTTGRRDEVLAVGVADGVVNKIGDRDWAELSNVAWLADGSGLVTVGRDRGRNNQISLVAYPSGQTRKITNDLNYYRGESLSLSADGKLAVLQGATSPSIWTAPNGDARQARTILKGTETRQEGLQGLTWTPDGRLLYVASVGDSQTIWAMNFDGSEHRQLLPHHGHAFDNEMRVTADGRYMVFHSNRSGSLEIWRANVDGSDLKQLTTGGGNSQPGLSPDGRWVVYASAREGKQTLWRMTVAGGEASKLTDSASSWPQVSPDGKYIAYAQPSDVDHSEVPPLGALGRADLRLMIVPFEGGKPVKSYVIPITAALGNGSLTWTQDGKAIMYKDLIQGLWRQALDEERPQSIKGFERVRVHHLAWSFDGQTLVYTTGTATREIILIENFR